MEKPKQPFFNVSDPTGELRRQIAKATEGQDTSRSRFCREAIRQALAKHEGN